MWRAFLFVLGICFAKSQTLHITNSIPFGASSLKVVFSSSVESLDLKPIKISNNAVYIDIKAVLDNGKKVYFFPRNAQVTIAQNTPQITRFVITNGNGVIYQIKLVQNNLYLSFVDKIPESIQDSKATPKPTQPKQEQKPPTKSPAPSSASSPIKPIESTPPSPSSPKPKKGYKVVIDAGHGGKDCGTLGVTKVCEKHIVLKVATHLSRELKKRGYITYMTRDKDVYLNLKERTDFANAKNADLFVSIHANSVPKSAKKSPKGVETYFLSTARSDRARDVAEQENKDDIDVMNYFSKQTFLNSLNSHRLLASNKLAIDIQYGILKRLRQKYQGVTDGGVREGPFWVLAGALMPSVLIEIGYNSSPIEAPRLNDDAYQRSLAVGIADGIDGFVVKNF
ncbi:N-acetylmuramoyl-L-alanine amidase [Helicobacter sp.]|uniref:N-acetylmuramoyl-L-alanine amidase family protein n=1 Tax=Helicobacter sp. TaxID=218 RepID=UPI0025C09110|nr:N-acetylmuramoyl-L-alanine amidase [Helicobacter sp.]MBR2494290.1 N-acetylmuramoyl-L-alanine amidase [Helicobacter sp.]